MVYEFKFPDVGEGITEGTIVKWKVKENENVKADQILAEVETDKAVVEIPSPRKGTILKLYHKEGDVINVGEIIAVIGKKGKKVPEKADHYTGSVVGFLPEAKEGGEKPLQKKKPVLMPGEEKIRAAPIVRKFAKMLGVDLTKVNGTGPEERITEQDVKDAAQVKKPEPVKKGIKITKKYD